MRLDFLYKATFLYPLFLNVKLRTVFFLLTLHAYPILWPCTAESVGHLPPSQSFQEMGTSPLSFHAAFHYPQHPGTCESHKANKQMYNQILESVKKKRKPNMVLKLIKS